MAIALGALVAGGIAARAAEPVRIGVISEEGAVAGASISRAAQMAADDINAQGGVNGAKIEIVTYDNHSSASDAVRAFQRAVNQDHRFNPDTTDFTPIFNAIEAKHPDVIITGISHVGVQPTVQWHDQQVPIPMAGQSSQATTSTFWKSTNGAAEGVITASAAVPGVALTPSTIPFTEAYTKRFGDSPAYDGYSAYDDVHIIAEAIKNAGSTDPDKMVATLEKTDYVGTLGRVQFYGREDQFTHALKYGKDYITLVDFQWQSGKQVCIWPLDKCHGKLVFPSFVHLPQESAAK
jgi:branched-chain amino acid transport system substrate-binding protein